MAFRGWWEELQRDTEIMPNLRNVKERQIDYIEVEELFNECRQDSIDSGTHETAIGSQVPYAPPVHPLASVLRARRARVRRACGMASGRVSLVRSRFDSTGK
jgi:hypothetical protein